MWSHLVKQYNEPLSRGVTQIKYNQDIQNPRIKKLYEDNGLDSEYDLNTPEGAATATVLRAADIYANKNLANNQYKWNNGEPISNEDAMMLSWQYGSINNKTQDGSRTVAPERHNSRKAYSKYEYDTKKIIK